MQPMLTAKILTASLLLCLAALLSVSRALADDEKIWAALKQGGKVILLRHTHVDIREGIGRLAPGNCAAEVNLSTSGVESRPSASEKPSALTVLPLGRF